VVSLMLTACVNGQGIDQLAGAAPIEQRAMIQ
jgi:hypothetical protein